jgi:hypothetical protein
MDVLLRHLEAGLAEMDARSAAGLAEFERSLQTGMFDSARALKGQMEGPITMASYLFNGDRPLAAVPNCLRAVTAHVVRLAQRRFECFDNSDCRSCFLWMNPVYALPAKRPAARCETVRSPTVSVRCETPAQSLACIAAPHSRLIGCAWQGPIFFHSMPIRDWSACSNHRKAASFCNAAAQRRAD